MSMNGRTALNPELALLAQGPAGAAQNDQVLSELRNETEGEGADWMIAEPEREATEARAHRHHAGTFWGRLFGARKAGERERRGPAEQRI